MKCFETINYVYKQRASIFNDIKYAGYDVKTRVLDTLIHAEDSRRGNRIEEIIRDLIYSECGSTNDKSIPLKNGKNADIDLFFKYGEDKYVVEIKVTSELDSKKISKEREEILQKSETLGAQPIILFVADTINECKNKKNGIREYHGIKKFLTDIFGDTKGDLLFGKFNMEVSSYDANPKVDWDNENFIDSVLNECNICDLEEIIADKDMEKIVSVLSPNGNLKNEIEKTNKLCKIKKVHIGPITPAELRERRDALIA